MSEPTDRGGATGVAIRPIDVRAISDDDIKRTFEFGELMRAEMHPDDPPMPFESYAAQFKAIPTFIDIWVFVAELGDEIVGTASGSVMRTGENEHLLQSDIAVKPEARRQGVGSRLLAELVPVAEAEKRRLLVFWTQSRVPAGKAFAERIGAKAGLVHRVSEIEVASLDRDLVDRWVAEGPDRAPGYELVLRDGAYPEDEYEIIAEALDIMNTAPREELELGDWRTTPEQLRERGERLAVTGDRRLTLFARHNESGRYVGFTGLGWNPKTPELVHQGGTAVHPDHRGHALGKWLKAAMIQELLRQNSEAKVVRTDNAYTNDAMLGINNALGFEEKSSSIGWQIDTDKARAYVDSMS